VSRFIAEAIAEPHDGGYRQLWLVVHGVTSVTLDVRAPTRKQSLPPTQPTQAVSRREGTLILAALLLTSGCRRVPSCCY
jgi:hypothetical protein